MSLPRYTARRDATEPLIVAALEAVGAVVVPLSARDLPDLIVGHRGAWHLIECKAATAKLRAGQVAFFVRAVAHGLPVHIARTPEEALAAIGIKTKGDV